ncbi:uncharacterized protein F4807DRAFT_463089 [Annulohypoxylon truncatum]|uniref:uncharacterized protein n=1 Tax=Annulohypoxylon truncatum TaxID=327061 RepID=UPI0020076F14|nr:uncharacterized protein F4807DRAFT_463089 [Annulohypoxylon truncatum]KAI1207025.1 hypothetical protein F4807DRAFT_463089 [Annulohypoxylon truncatum]
MAGDNLSTNQSQAGESANQSTSSARSSPVSKLRRSISFIRSLGKLGKANKDKEEKSQSTTPVPKVKGTLEVQTSHATLPTPDIFSNPNSPFFRGDGAPISRSTSLRSVSSDRPQSPSVASTSQAVPTTTGFQWKPQAVLSVADVKDPEAQSRVEHVITRCGLDDKKVSPQEAYDALRMAKGSVDGAYALIKKGEHIYSSAVDDPEVREHLQNIGVLPPDAPRRKKVRFAHSHTYIN